MLRPRALPNARLLRLTRTLPAALLGGCGGIQSTFSAFGVEAESTRILTIAMTLAAAVITAGVLWIAWHAVRAPRGQIDHERGMRVILWLGAVFPTVTLTVLLVTSLPTMRAMDVDPSDLRIAVSGEQFWWRVRYQPGTAEPIETANEIRVPVGRTVSFALTSPDVIHSFWIPGLAGKVDMIPGHSNELVVRATNAGVYRGVCAEFCGLSHARMAFDVVAMEPAAFNEWLAHIASPAVGTTAAGRALFQQYGCDGCHSIRGHFDGSPIGPDLTHFGLRRSFAAGALPTSRDSVSHFIRDATASKPGVLMPTFELMSVEDAAAIAIYLLELR